jgi:hypothetical protein
VKWFGRIDFATSFVCPAKDRADPGVGGLEVDPRVTGQRHHSADVKYVVLGAAGGQVRVLDRTDPYLRGDPRQLVISETVLPLSDDRPSLSDSCVEQVEARIWS